MHGSGRVDGSFLVDEHYFASQRSPELKSSMRVTSLGTEDRICVRSDGLWEKHKHGVTLETVCRLVLSHAVGHPLLDMDQVQ